MKGDLVFNEDRVSLFRDESLLEIGYNNDLICTTELHT